MGKESSTKRGGRGGEEKKTHAAEQDVLARVFGVAASVVVKLGALGLCLCVCVCVCVCVSKNNRIINQIIIIIIINITESLASSVQTQHFILLLHAAVGTSGPYFYCVFIRPPLFIHTDQRSVQR